MSRERRRQIWTLALPIIGGMVSQNVLNIVDVAMVSRVGPGAPGAVGLGGFVNFVLSAFVLGLSVGVQALASRRVGEGRGDVAAIPLNGGLLLAASIALPWSGLWCVLTPSVFPLLNDDPTVRSFATPYIQIRLLAMTPLAMNFAFRGFWNATDRPRLYMQTLVKMHALNIFLNWLLIFGNLGAPKLGVSGAAVASAISVTGGTIWYFMLARRHASEQGFLRTLPVRAELFTQLRLSVPSGVQQVFFAAGLVAFMVIVGRVGTRALDATTGIVNLVLVGLLPSLGFGLAASTLVGQALGRGDAADAKAWGWDVVRIASTLSFLLMLPMVVFPHAFLLLLIDDPVTAALGVPSLRLVGLTMAVDTAGMVLMNAMMGAGATRTSAAVSVGCQWFVFIPLAALLGPVLGMGLSAIWAANVGYRALQALIFAVVWRRGAWAQVQM